jgi:hypothetical protein
LGISTDCAFPKDAMPRQKFLDAENFMWICVVRRPSSSEFGIGGAGEPARSDYSWAGSGNPTFELRLAALKVGGSFMAYVNLARTDGVRACLAPLEIPAAGHLGVVDRFFAQHCLPRR